MTWQHKKNTPRRPQTQNPAAEEDDSLIWGINAVQEALSSSPRRLSEILIEKGKGGVRIQEIIDAARQQHLRIRFVDLGQAGLPRGCRHQGVAARQTEASLVPVADLIAQAADRILLLDSIQDPRNLGSILRSALAAGFSSVILTRERSAPLSATVARTSAGAIAHLQIALAVNLSDALQQLKDQGFWIYGAVAEREAQPIYATDFSGKIGIVIGGEEKGIRPLVRTHCDHLVTIPMFTDFNSLNASVAAALIMFEVVRQSRQMRSI